jgi:hypothetical protein
MLIDLGANVNIQNEITGATPLHCAVQSTKSLETRTQVIQLLLEKGKADVSLGDTYGTIPLNYCTEDEDGIMKLLQSVTPPIFIAIQDKKGEQIESILREDPTAVEVRYMLQTPLLLVVHQLLETSDMMQVQLLRDSTETWRRAKYFFYIS